MITYPATLPFALQVARALTDSLAEITPAAGYHFDMSAFDRGDGVETPRVYRGRSWFGDGDPIPMLSLLEGVSPADEVAEFPENCPTGAFDWPFFIQGFVDDDPQHPTDPARVLLADARRCLALQAARKRGRQPDPLGLGRVGESNVSRVVGMRIGFGTARPADDVSARAYFWLPLTIRVVDHADSL